MKKAVFVLAAIAFIWTSGLAWFTVAIDGYRKTDPNPVQAIVVLTGGPQRLRVGLEMLARHQSARLLISGVHPQFRLETFLENQHFETSLTTRIDLDHTASNTRENARQCSPDIRVQDYIALASEKHEYTSLRLVTSDYHMIRSLIEFRRAIPPSIRIIPHGVPSEPSFETIFIEYNKVLMTFGTL